MTIRITPPERELNAISSSFKQLSDQGFRRKARSAIQRRLKTLARPIVASMRARTPIDTGGLRRSIGLTNFSRRSLIGVQGRIRADRREKLLAQEHSHRIIRDSFDQHLPQLTAGGAQLMSDIDADLRDLLKDAG